MVNKTTLDKMPDTKTEKQGFWLLMGGKKGCVLPKLWWRCTSIKTKPPAKVVLQAVGVILIG